MCHLVLALPLLALPVLWLLPAGVALPLYAGVVALAAVVFGLALLARRRPVCAGAEDLLHAVGTVREVDGRRLTVWVKSELWAAEADAEEALSVGDAVEVLGLEGLTLRVRRLPPAHGGGPQAAQAGARCH